MQFGAGLGSDRARTPIGLEDREIRRHRRRRSRASEGAALGCAPGRRDHLEPHGGTEPPAPHFAIDHREQIVGLVLENLEIHVAGDAEGIAPDDLHPREQVARAVRDQVFEGEELASSSACRARRGAQRAALKARSGGLSGPSRARSDAPRSRDPRPRRPARARDSTGTGTDAPDRPPAA